MPPRISGRVEADRPVYFAPRRKIKNPPGFSIFFAEIDRPQDPKVSHPLTVDAAPLELGLKLKQNQQIERKTN